MKTKYDRTGFGPISWACLIVVLYALASVAIGMATRDDKTCAFGYEQKWQVVPPHWVCR